MIMYRRNKTIIALLFFVYLVNLTKAQTEIPAQVRYEVQLEASESSQTCLSLHARLFNDSHEDIYIPLWGSARYNDFFRFEIVGPDGQKLVGPTPERFPVTIPAGITPLRSVPRVGNSPFVPVKANGMVECDIAIGPPGNNTQIWYIPHPGQYTLNAEFVNTHSTYVDSQTHEVVKMDNAFIGNVKAPPVQFSISPSTTEGIDAQSGVTIAGITLDERGKPIVEAVVEITSNRDLRPGEISGTFGPITRTIDRQRSDTEGKFMFWDLPTNANSYTIRAVHDGNYVQAIVVLSNEEMTSRTDVKITMKDGLTIRGKVVDPNGLTLAGARVTGHGSTIYPELSKLEILAIGSAHQSEVYAGENGEFVIQGVERLDCSFYCLGFKTRDASPITGHENDGTWIVVLEPSETTSTVSNR
jgi:hypothetical protein